MQYRLPPAGTKPALFMQPGVLSHRLPLIVTADALRPVRKLVAHAVHDLHVPLGSIGEEPLARAPLRYQLSGEFPGSPGQAHRLMRLLLVHLSLPQWVLVRLETPGEAARTPEYLSGGHVMARRSVHECRDVRD